jgi:hypothetical protein
LGFLYQHRRKRFWRNLEVSRLFPPLEYSARSVVQDNRAGALKNDFVLLFAFEGNSRRDFRNIPGWSKHYPEGALKEDAVNV